MTLNERLAESDRRIITPYYTNGPGHLLRQRFHVHLLKGEQWLATALFDSYSEAAHWVNNPKIDYVED